MKHIKSGRSLVGALTMPACVYAYMHSGSLFHCILQMGMVAELLGKHGLSATLYNQFNFIIDSLSYRFVIISVIRVVSCHFLDCL